MPNALDALAALPPWDAARYFQTIRETNFPLANNKDQLVTADPNRIGLIFSTTSQSSVTVTLQNSSLALQGLSMSSSQPPLVLLFRDFGPLVQQAWYAGTSFGSANITVYEIKLQRWPQQRPAVEVKQNADAAQPKQRAGYVRPHPNRTG